MKNKILSIVIILFLIGMVFVLTGCGNKQSNNIVNELNSVVNEDVAKWQERQYATTFTVFNIQSGLRSKDLQYIIVASGDKEFTSAPDFLEYKEKDIPNYDGTSYSYMRMLEETNTVKHFVVFEPTSKKYYDVEVNYAESKINGIGHEYPVFSNAKELK